MLPEPAHRVGVGRADDRDARRERLAHVRAGEVEPVREAVHLERDARLERDLEDPLQVERVLGPVVEDPALRMGEARRRRVAHRLDDAVGERLARPALAGVQADLHPLELGEHVVREVERAVREDVALAARGGSGTARAASFAAAISSAWRRRSSASSPGTTRTLRVWSQTARYS